MPKSSTFAALAVCLAVLGAGCSNANRSGAPRASAVEGGTQAPGTREPADRVCAVVTAGDASALFGAPAARNTSSAASANTSECIWNATVQPAAGSPARYTLTATIVDHGSRSALTEVSGVTPVSAVGETAWVDTSAQGIVVVEFLKNGKTVRLALSTWARDAHPPDPRDREASLIALSKQVAARL